MSVTKVSSAPLMMPGTESDGSYYAFGRKGNVLLGVKPKGMIDGGALGVEGTTYFAARIRSAPGGALLGPSNAGKVVRLQPNPPNLWDAWPDVTWEKKDEVRASTSIGVFIKGSFSETAPGQMNTLLEAVANRKMANEMVTYLFGLAGDGNTIVDKEDLAFWVDGYFDAAIKRVLSKIKASKEVKVEMTKQVGVFGMQSSILKKIHQKYAQSGDKKDE